MQSEVLCNISYVVLLCMTNHLLLQSVKSYGHRISIAHHEVYEHQSQLLYLTMQPKSFLAGLDLKYLRRGLFKILGQTKYQID